LSTSREALNIQAELPWRVPSLTRPRFSDNGDSSTAPAQAHFTPDALVQFEAVALFIERAHTHQPDFVLTTANAPAVAHICSRLDGIPLALEMAAARVNAFTVEEPATRLDGAFDVRFQLLTSGARTAPFRHQTLRATLEWSYALLTPSEQRLLVRLSVFSGGWTASAIEAVTGCSLALLAQLVNKSLVIADQQAGQTRYRLLETVRQFATEQIRRAHARGSEQNSPKF
jgi:predicted ATPase